MLFGQSDLDRGERFFEKYGSWIVFFGRFVPLVRSIVSVPAGVERMPLLRFSLLTAAGSAVWNAVFVAAGYELGDRWEDVEGWIQPAELRGGAAPPRRPGMAHAPEVARPPTRVMHSSGSNSAPVSRRDLDPPPRCRHPGAAPTTLDGS